MAGIRRLRQPSRGVPLPILRPKIVLIAATPASNYGAKGDQAFRVVSDFEPAGDQPAAIAALSAGIDEGERFQSARHHRFGQVGHHRLDHRTDPAAHADPRPQQEARRPARPGDTRVLPRQPGRVLRLLLRLLPTRGVHRLERHLHRERLLDQRRDRPAAALRHRRAAHPARRDRRGVGVVHLRHGQSRGVQGQPARPQGRRRLRHAQHPAPPGRHAVRPQRHDARPRQLPRPGRHHRGASGLRGIGAPHRDVRRHDRSHHHHRPAHR